MLRLRRGAQALTLAIFAPGGSKLLCAGTQNQPQSAASILAQVREAPVVLPGSRSPNSARRARCWSMAKAGTIATIDDLRTGTRADRVELEGVGRVEDHADMPTQNWEQDNAGDVLLTPGGKEPEDIEDLYVPRNGWWDANFGGAEVMLL